MVASSLALFLAGCANSRLEKVQRLSAIAFGDSGVAYDPKQARQLPYATMDAKIGITPASLIVLNSVQGEDLFWQSQDQAILVTRHGRLISTAGLHKDLSTTQFLNPDPIVQRSPQPSASQRVCDYTENDQYGILLNSTWQSYGQETIDIYGEKKTVERLVEHVSSPLLDWEHDNTFWRDQNRFVWKSVQHFSPDTPPAELAVLKPYAAPKA